MRRAFVSLCLIPAISPVALADSQASPALELQAVNIDATSDRSAPTVR